MTGIVAHFRAHPGAMAAFDDLAARHGQELECALVGPNGQGFQEDDVIVAWKARRQPLAIIHADGTMDEMAP